MNSILNYVLNNFLNEKDKLFNKDNALINYLDMNCVNAFISTGIIDSKQYSVGYSIGKGVWATIPWIAIFDNDISTSASKGYYIVYLFSADMKKVYLSLNQGWTYFKSQYGGKLGKEKIKKVVEMWQIKLKSNLEEFTFDPINLEYYGSGTDLPRGYELGHICGKCYNANNLPDEDNLKKDLQNMISLFRELKGNMKYLSIEDTNNYLLAHYVTTSVKEDRNHYIVEENGENEILANEGRETLLNILNRLPAVVNLKQNRSNDSIKTIKESSTDYQQKTKIQERVGRIGEFIVLENERKKLIGMNSSKKVEHVSITQNDMAGYDILSFDEDGNKMLIEVKSTKGGINTPFYLTAYELEYLNSHKDNYYIYRLYNINVRKKTADCYIIKGDQISDMNVVPDTYKVFGLK
jgi:hypothetical protein